MEKKISLPFLVKVQFNSPDRQWEEKEEVLVDTLDEYEHHVVLYNDDINTFDFVINCLIRICGHDPIQAEQCTFLVHFKGKATVKTGDDEELKVICTALCDKGLSAVIE